MKDVVEKLAHLRHDIAEQENMLAEAEAALRSTAQWAEVERRYERLQAMKLDYARVYIPRAVKLVKSTFEKTVRVLEPDS